MNITVRQRERGKNITLYLDIYENGVRRFESLGLKLKKEPIERRLTSDEKKINRIAIETAEQIRIKRLYEYLENRYELNEILKTKEKFIDWTQSVIASGHKNKSESEILQSLQKILVRYDKLRIKLSDLNATYIEGFRNYLIYYVSDNTKKRLSANTQSIYWQRFKMILSEGCKSGLIPVKLLSNSGTIKGSESEKECLEFEEIKLLERSFCVNQKVKKAFLFMCYTGMRFSDVSKLKYSDIKIDSQGNYILKFRQQKTNNIQVLPITEKAYNLTVFRDKNEVFVFPGLNYSNYMNNLLQEWVKNNGIEKRITFHSARHTYAALNLESGNDIYTLSKLLGHKSIKTTEIYARVSNTKKIEAVKRCAI